MKYVQRNEGGAVIAVYDRPQIGQEPVEPGSIEMVEVDYAPEQLADDNPEVLAWYAAQAPKVWVQRDAEGRIVAKFAARQEGIAEEALPENHPDLQPPLPAVRAEKLAQINVAFEHAAAVLTADYPPSERLTWPAQETEALAWQANNAAPTPYIDALATARGIARVDHLNRTLTKVAAFRTASARIVGARQRYSDQVKAAATASAVRAIDPVFTLS